MPANTEPHRGGSAAPVRQMLDVVVIGEALTDIVTTSGGMTEHPGGSPANVAYGLARLGVSTGLLTAVGADPRGAALENHLESAGVVLLPGSRSLERTSTATATIAADGSASYAFDILCNPAPRHAANLGRQLKICHCIWVHFHLLREPASIA